MNLKNNWIIFGRAKKCFLQIGTKKFRKFWSTFGVTRGREKSQLFEVQWTIWPIDTRKSISFSVSFYKRKARCRNWSGQQSFSFIARANSQKYISFDWKKESDDLGEKPILPNMNNSSGSRRPTSSSTPTATMSVKNVLPRTLRGFKLKPRYRFRAE